MPIPVVATVSPPTLPAPHTPFVPGDIRRFEVPDVDSHGGWMIARFNKAYPHIETFRLFGWLRGLVYNNEFLFLYQDHSVSLAQLMRPDAFSTTPVIWERFVWAKNPEDPLHVAEAAKFYERFKTWAGHQDARQIVVEEQTDVPREMIVAILGKLLERRQVFARM